MAQQDCGVALVEGQGVQPLDVRKRGTNCYGFGEREGRGMGRGWDLEMC